MRQILFIQGGGADVHDAWDNKLVDSLRRELGEGYEVRYPIMPDEDDPSYAKWARAIREAIAMCPGGGRGPGQRASAVSQRAGPRPSPGNRELVVVGHSIGATILIQALAEQPPERRLGAIVLVSAPFVGEGGWPGDEFELSGDLGARLPKGVPVHVFHGLKDETAPPAHADLYARVVPQAEVHRLAGRDHQLNNDLGEVAEVVRAI